MDTLIECAFNGYESETVSEWERPFPVNDHMLDSLVENKSMQDAYSMFSQIVERFDKFMKIPSNNRLMVTSDVRRPLLVCVFFPANTKTTIIFPIEHFFRNETGPEQPEWPNNH